MEEEAAGLLKRMRRLMSMQTRVRRMLQLLTRLHRLRPMSCLEEHPAQQQQTETTVLAGDNARDRMKSIQRRTSNKAFELNGE